MMELESAINSVLDRLVTSLARSTWESRRRYFNQLKAVAKQMGINEPCQELYDSFIADDHGSAERRAMHTMCVKLLDAYACTNARGQCGVLYNEPEMPVTALMDEYFKDVTFPSRESLDISFLILKAEHTMRHLALTASTSGQYRHAFMEIRRYFHDRGQTDYSLRSIHSYVCSITELRDTGRMKQWKWKINRKAACILMEVAATGDFIWRKISKNKRCDNHGLEKVRQRYVGSLKERNLSQNTIDLHDYVFRNALKHSKTKGESELYKLAPANVQSMVAGFAGKCNKRSMATILPILRAVLGFLFGEGDVKNNLAGMVMSGFVQRRNVAAYLSRKDEDILRGKLEMATKRDKAVIMLALSYGLRDCDICGLTLDGIDWRNDRIGLIQKKTGKPMSLPLLPDVGNALMDYILNERPNKAGGCSNVFLRMQAPHNRLSSVYSICSKFFTQNNIQPVNGSIKGIHIFRYTVVHRLLEKKVPHQIITEILGHTSREADKPYLSLEEGMLKECALDLSVIGSISWKGGGVNA
jgi:integrase